MSSPILLVDPEGNCHCILSGEVKWTAEFNKRTYFFNKEDDVNKFFDVDFARDGKEGVCALYFKPSKSLEQEIIDFDMYEELRPKIALKLHASNESLVMTQNRATLHVDYNNGFIMEPGANSFEIVRIDFDIRFYKFNSSMIAWQLEFSRYFAMRPSISKKPKPKGVPCQVLQCRDEDMFVKICDKLGVTKFPNGRNPNNTLWNRLTNTSRIKTSGHEVELDKTGMCEGMFDDVEATVFQIKVDDKGDVREIVRRLRSLDRHPNVLRFYEAEGNDLKRLFAFERLQRLEEFVKSIPNKPPDKLLPIFMLDMYRGILDFFDLLRNEKIHHGRIHSHNVFLGVKNTVKFSLLDIVIREIKTQKGPRFTSVGAETKDNLFTLGEYIIYCGSGGQYKFSKSSVTGFSNKPNNDVKLIDESFQETRDIALKLLNPRPELRPLLPEVYAHPFLWDDEKRMRFFSKVSEYLKRFSKNKVLSPIENEIDSKMQLIVGCNSWADSKFNYTPNCLTYMKKLGYRDNSVCSLVRLHRNVYQDFEEILFQGYTDFGNSRYEVEGIFRHRYPHLLMCVHEAVKIHAKHDFPEYF